MKFLSVLLLLLSFSPVYSQETIVLLSPDDCINCAANLKYVLEDTNNQHLTIISKGAFIDDSDNVRNKFNLHHYPIIWSDSLYDALHGETRTKLIIKDGGLVKEYVLKSLSYDTLRRLLSSSIHLPARFRFKVAGDNIFVQDLLTNIIRLGSIEVTYTDSMLQGVYQKYYGKESADAYKQYMDMQTQYPQLKPSFTNFEVLDSKTINILGYCYIFEQGKMGHVSAKKIFAIFQYDFYIRKVKNIFYVDPNVDDSAYSINGLNFFSHGNDFYFSIGKNNIVAGSQEQLYFIEKAKNVKGVIKKETILPLLLPKAYVDKKVYYNMDDPIVSYPYLMLPIANDVFNIQNETSPFSVPFDSKCMSDNNPMGALQSINSITFYIQDILFDKNLYVVYSKYDYYYLAKFDVKSNKIVYDEKISDLKKKEIISSPQFDKVNDHKIYFFRKKDKQLITYPFE